MLVCPFTVPETGEVCGEDVKRRAPGRPTLGVDPRRRIFHCFRCDAGRGLAGDAAVMALLAAHLGVSEVEAGRIVEGGEYEAPVPTYDPARIHRLVSSSSSSAGGAGRPVLDYRLLPYDSVLGREAWEYLTGRGVTSEQIATHRIGVAVKGRMAGRVILPALQSGSMVYYVARAIDGRQPKYLNPSAEDMPHTASDVIVNLDVAVLYGHVRLVEGYFDMLAMAPTGCALLGKVLSPAQLDLLAAAKRARPSLTVSVLLAGAGTVSRAHALRMAGQLEAVGFRGVPVEVPDGDPGDRRGTREVVPYSLRGLIAARVGT